MTIRLDPTAQTCLPTAVPVEESGTLAIDVAGYECDFSCAEHWDDSFLAAPNDIMGTVHLAFTAHEQFGAPGGPGHTTTYSALSQPDLTRSKSRHFSAGDYRLSVSITEASMGSP